MDGEYQAQDAGQRTPVSIEFDSHLVSPEALLKTAYWFSRDFYCDIRSAEELTVVSLRPKDSALLHEGIRQEFLNHALDFALRERVNQQTADVRDLLLAKAFSESGVLEDAPQGTFGDMLEEAKPDGMFKILNNR